MECDVGLSLDPDDRVNVSECLFEVLKATLSKTVPMQLDRGVVVITGLWPLNHNQRNGCGGENHVERLMRFEVNCRANCSFSMSTPKRERKNDLEDATQNKIKAFRKTRISLLCV